MIGNFLKIMMFLLVVFSNTVMSQNTVPPFYIQSIQLRSLQENNFTNIVPLGTTLELSFDDLSGDSESYYFLIEHQTHDWKSSDLMSNQYINGFQKNLIVDFQNSFNTLQNYIHYSVQFPNQQIQITQSGNYLISVLDQYDDVVFSRRFTLYQSDVTVGVSVSRSRDTKMMDEDQTVEFTINHPGLRIDNPSQEIHVAVVQNNNWNTSITDIQPTFFKPNQLIYSYTNQTNFKGGNEFLFIDTKTIRNKSLNIAKIQKDALYNLFLFPFEYNEFKTYRYNPDINGQFVIRTLEGSEPDNEADYAMMHFSLLVDTPFKNKEVYIYGAFNDFELTPQNKLLYDESQGLYTTRLVLKQGFYNYTFVTKSLDGKVMLGGVLGDFYQTENEYAVIVYYKPLGSLFDQVIGVGTANFAGEQ